MTNTTDTDTIIYMVMNLLARHFGFADRAAAQAMTPSFEGFDHDKYEWSSSGNYDHITIYWEEGPEEWAYNIPEEVRGYLRTKGLFAEAMNSWSIGVYPA